MPKLAVKIAISLPNELYRAIERARKRCGKTRSALAQDALRHWLKHQQEAGWIREYVEGYRRMPESPSEIEAANAMAVRSLSTEEW